MLQDVAVTMRLGHDEDEQRGSADGASSQVLRAVDAETESKPHVTADMLAAAIAEQSKPKGGEDPAAALAKIAGCGCDDSEEDTPCDRSTPVPCSTPCPCEKPCAPEKDLGCVEKAAEAKAAKNSIKCATDAVQKAKDEEEVLKKALVHAQAKTQKEKMKVAMATQNAADAQQASVKRFKEKAAEAEQEEKKALKKMQEAKSAMQDNETAGIDGKKAAAEAALVKAQGALKEVEREERAAVTEKKAAKDKLQAAEAEYEQKKEAAATLKAEGIASAATPVEVPGEIKVAGEIKVEEKVEMAPGEPLPYAIDRKEMVKPPVDFSDINVSLAEPVTFLVPVEAKQPTPESKVGKEQEGKAPDSKNGDALKNAADSGRNKLSPKSSFAELTKSTQTKE